MRKILGNTNVQKLTQGGDLHDELTHQLHVVSSAKLANCGVHTHWHAWIRMIAKP